MKQTSSCAVERGEIEVIKVTGNRLMWEVACLPPRAMMISGAELQLRAMSGFIALLQPGSVLM